MKKLFTTLFAVLGFFTLAHAQQSKGVELGIGIGYNGASVSNDNNHSTKSKSGFNAAISVDNYFSDRWSLKAKAIYDQKGWAEGYLGEAKGIDFSLNYLTVPVMANWHFGKTRNWYLNFGPYVGFLLSADASQFNGSLKQFFNSADGGLAYGIGVKLPVADKTKFFIEFDGQNGVTDLFAEGASPYAIRSVRGAFNIGFNF
ncbi:porin family protein [Mucilaginibacter auburnensis]|uniref:Outer membrane protein with beta-barrel domain n=1 Tax=Mucilaginibacter auburnensis TaxID=1457233 RepID=A0A2H9VSL2_9SPHI|nr:porin family protein [Mucilaginibacter auburnensis]PJJ83816.1 outer membrane protein with beta-barrel domain [Mucilaginibacter auburnensis]